MSLQVASPTPQLATSQNPINGGNANVVPEQNQLGRICAYGTAVSSDGNNSNPSAVYGAIYTGQHLPGDAGIPTSPPQGTHAAQLMSQNWYFQRLSGAAYGSNGNYPWNTLVIWAQYLDGSQDMSFIQFRGVQAQLTDCGN